MRKRATFLSNHFGFGRFLLGDKRNGNLETSEEDWFGLVSLFNGISTFVGYLMPKLFS